MLVSRTLNRVCCVKQTYTYVPCEGSQGADFKSVLNPVIEKKLQMERTAYPVHTHSSTQITKVFAGKNSSICQSVQSILTQYFHRIYKYNISIWQDITSSRRNSLFGVEGLKGIMCHGSLIWLKQILNQLSLTLICNKKKKIKFWRKLCLMKLRFFGLHWLTPGGSKIEPGPIFPSV